MAEHNEICVVLRDETGAISPNVAVNVWDDSGATTRATLYTTRTGTATYANPVSATGDGVLHFFSEKLRLWYTTATQTEPLPLPVNGMTDLVTDVINVKDYGAVGDGVTDDTAAVQAALDAAKAYGAGSTVTVYNRPPLYFPPGDYLCDGFTIEDCRFLRIIGAGWHNTSLIPSGTDPFFSLSVFTTTPANAWVGGADAQGFTCEGVTFRDPSKQSWTNVGVNQTKIGIQDNGAGWCKFRDCNFDGLLYGIYAPYGHDYAWYYDCNFERCTTAFYYGPGSQQIFHYGTTGGTCGKFGVIEGAAQGAFFGCVFNETKTRDFEFRRPTTLVSGVTTLSSQNNAEVDWAFYSCWFETGAGWGTGWEPLEHFLIGSASDSYVMRGIKLYNVRLLSGTNGMGDTQPHYFINADKGKFVEINGITVAGSYVDAIFTHPAGTYYDLRVSGLKTFDGYTAMTPHNNWEVGCHADDIRDGTNTRTPPPSFFAASAEPTTGYHAKGEICFNSLPDSTESVGWVCTVAGTPGTWKSFGTVAS